MAKKILLYLVAGIVIFMSGLYIGHEKGINKYVYLQDQSNATELQIDLKLLNNLRDGEINKSKEMLEYLADNNIQYLYWRLKEHNQQAEKKILEALVEAKKYRAEHPEHKSDKYYSKTIDEMLSTVGE